MSTTTQSTSSPLVLGVSGHRNLHPQEEPRLRGLIEEFFRDLRRRLPDTEVRIMVGMAQGADLLVAQTALAMGWKVDALLPMPLAEYVQDFDRDSSAALLALLDHPSVHCTVLTDPADAPPNGVVRDASYAKLMEALIDKCNTLLALWNGKTSALAGGTADTVLRYLGARNGHTQDASGGAVELIDADAEAPWRPHFVYWIPTRRSDDEAPLSPTPRYLTGVGENLLAVHAVMPPALDQQLAELNTYNREFERLRKHGALQLDTLMSALQADVPDAHRALLQRIDFEYGKADALAIHYQRRSDRLFRWFSYMASGMALLFLVYAKLFASGVLLSLYLAVLLLSLVVFFWVRRHHWFSKHLVYRVLAETMRTRFFLCAAGADRLVNASELMSLTGIGQFAGFSWIGNLLKNIEPLKFESGPDAVAEEARLRGVYRTWIRGQQDYFNARVRKLERNHMRLDRMKSVMLAAVAALAVVLLLFSDLLRTPVAGAVSWKDLAIFMMGLLPVLLGVWELYQNKMAMRELLWQYRNQLSHFTRAERQLSRTADLQRQKDILAQVGKESLMESYLWTIHRYHREYEPPAVG